MAYSLSIGLPRTQGDRRPIYLPDCQRNVLVTGATGKGKTHSVITPAVRSAIAQGLPIILYDYKYPDQTSLHVGLAARAGYKIHIFAPTFPESGIFNPMDFLDSGQDTTSAKEFAKTWQRNVSRRNSQRPQDAFFTGKAESAIQGALTRMKGTPYPDLLAAYQLINLPNLAFRIDNDCEMNPFVRLCFDSIISVRASEETLGGVLGSAQLPFEAMTMPDILPMLVGNSTIPLHVGEREMLILGLNFKLEETIAPILAAVLHLVLKANAHINRGIPLAVFLDEHPTLYLPDLPKWMTTFRAFDIGFFLAQQHMAQCDRVYGAQARAEIEGACGTKVIFNPQEFNTARQSSDYLGKEDFFDTQQSRTTGQKQGSVSRTSIRKTRYLIEPDALLRFETGKGIFISHAFEQGGEHHIPVVQKVKIPPRDLALSEASKRLWPSLRDSAIRNSPLKPVSPLDLEERRAYVEKMMPSHSKDGERVDIF